MVTTQEFFDQQEKRRFPLPKSPKPYTHIKSLYGGQIEVAHKDNGTGRITLFGRGEEEKDKKLYLQGVYWQELERQASILRSTLMVRDAELDRIATPVVDWR